MDLLALLFFVAHQLKMEGFSKHSTSRFILLFPVFVCMNGEEGKRREDRLSFYFQVLI